MHIDEVSDYVIGSSLAEIVTTEYTKISNQNDVDRGSNCEVRQGRRSLTLKLNLSNCLLIICFTFVTKSPGTTLDEKSKLNCESVSILTLRIL